MSSRYLAFNVVCVFVVVLFTTVTKVELCELLKDESLKIRDLDIESRSFTGETNDMFSKCGVGTSSCSNCVPTGYKLVNVTYLVHSKDKEVRKLAYNVTGCECVAKPPLNAVVKHNSEQSYMNQYMMMSYCTYALAAVCAVLGLIIVFMCIRYEMLCSGNKQSEKIAKYEQTRPLAVKQASQEENV